MFYAQIVVFWAFCLTPTIIYVMSYVLIIALQTIM